MKALLVLEDGTVFPGQTFSGVGEVDGEIVFNTSMTGYQEILTDPSYRGQIVTMTYPLIGNYGINHEDVESKRIQVEGFIVKEYEPVPSNWRSRMALADYLEAEGIIGIEGVDTRALTRHLRVAGAMKGIISTKDPDPLSLARKAKASPGLVGRDLVGGVTCREPYVWPGTDQARFHVVAFDFGIKFNIVRCLVERGCRVTVVPARTTAAEVRALNPDGVLLSNGPGDPEPITYAVKTIRGLLGERPFSGSAWASSFSAWPWAEKRSNSNSGTGAQTIPSRTFASGLVEIHQRRTTALCGR